MEADGKAVLVGSGTFMVDRARALEKLMRYALPDPAWGVLALVRFAAASQAGKFAVALGPRGELTLRFDGTPPSRAQLERPYDALFSRSARGDARGRDLAVGLLSLLRLEPAHVLVRAGREERLLLRLNRSDPEAVEPARDGETDTVVRFIPGPKTPPEAWSGLGPGIAQRGRMLPFAVVLDGQVLRPPAPALDEGRPVRGAGVRGWAAVPERWDVESRVELYRHGVLVGEVAEVLGGAPAVARVDCPAFRLNASQTAVVRNADYRKALAAVAAAAAGLVADAAARQAERAPQLTQLLKSNGLRGLWGRTVASWLEPARPRFIDALGHILGAASEQALDRELAKYVKDDARRACWLREAAAAGGEGPFAKAAAAARACPLYLSPDLSWHSRDELEATVAALGVLPVADRLNAAPRDYRVLWTACSGERTAAARWFPDVPVAAADDALDFEGRQGAWGGARRGSLLSRLGIVEAVARRPLIGAFEGELALPLQRPDAARIHVFSARDDELMQSLPVEGPLRFVAAVTARGPVRQQHARFALDGVKARLEELYAAAASDWSPGAASPTSDALRAHLFDALAHWGGEAPSWLAALPLFQCELGLFHAAALRQRLAEGDTLFFAPRAPGGPAPQLLFAHPALTAEFVRTVLPDARAKALPGRPDWTAAWRPRSTASQHGALEALEDVLRENGTWLLAPGTPQRRFLLEAVALNFAPWADVSDRDIRWRRVREHLSVLPLFSGADGAGLTPPQLQARVALDRPIPHAFATGDGAELVLDSSERQAFETLWPEAGRLLVSPAPAPQEPAPAGSARLAFAEPMLVARELEADGLRALVGLPPDPLPGVAVTVLGAGPAADFVLDTPGAGAAGRMLLDVSGLRGPAVAGEALRRDVAKTARGLYIAFIEKLVEGAYGDPAGERLRPYLLMLATPRKGAAGPWAAVRRRIEALPLFPTLGGGTASLGDLRRAAAKGPLRCARRVEAAPPEARDVPVVTTRALVEAALGTAVHDWTPESLAAGEGQGLEWRLERLLTRVRGRKGLDPALAPRRGALRLEKADGTALLLKEGPAWRVDAGHPAARLALDAGLDDTARAAYLLSALATAANRGAEAATDAEDALFQALLAEAAAEEE